MLRLGQKRRRQYHWPSLPVVVFMILAWILPVSRIPDAGDVDWGTYKRTLDQCIKLSFVLWRLSAKSRLAEQ